MSTAQLPDLAEPIEAERKPLSYVEINTHMPDLSKDNPTSRVAIIIGDSIVEISASSGAHYKYSENPLTSEDFALFCDLGDGKEVAVVCDGVGGEPGGEIASREAAFALQLYLANNPDEGLENAIRQVNRTFGLFRDFFHRHVATAISHKYPTNEYDTQTEAQRFTRELCDYTTGRVDLTEAPAVKKCTTQDCFQEIIKDYKKEVDSIELDYNTILNELFSGKDILLSAFDPNDKLTLEPWQEVVMARLLLATRIGQPLDVNIIPDKNNIEELLRDQIALPPVVVRTEDGKPVRLEIRNSGMSTTLAAVLIDRNTNTTEIANVGDASIFCGPNKVSTDHNIADTIFSNPNIRSIEDKIRLLLANRNLVTSTIGGRRSGMEVYCETIHHIPETIMLTTDGVTDYIRFGNLLQIPDHVLSRLSDDEREELDKALKKLESRLNISPNAEVTPATVHAYVEDRSKIHNFGDHATVLTIQNRPVST